MSATMPAVAFATDHVTPDLSVGERVFTCLEEGRYRLSTGDLGMSLETDRLRRDHHELLGELTVRCTLAGAPTVDGCLSSGSFNFSSPRARTERAALLAKRAKTGDLVDWPGLIEELCQRVLQAEREGDPSIDLRTVVATTDEPFYEVLGLRLPARHPSIIFGDGGVGKTWIAEIVAGELARQGRRVGYFDWELDRYEQTRRLRRLFGQVPELAYVECVRPLVHEVDRLKRIVREHRLEYAVLDSIAAGCAGPPEAAEVATDYYRANRQLGIGALHLAHITKSGDNNDQRPFGSTFWHNLARATWFAKRSDSMNADRLALGLYQRKASLGPLQPAVGIGLEFSTSGTGFYPIALAEVGDLAEGLPLWQRIKAQVSSGPKTYAALADELGTPVNSIVQAVKRRRQIFTLVSGGKDGISRVSLLERNMD